MKVVLAGYNTDAAILERARRREGESVTPEVLSASYARISRDPRAVGTLREEAKREVAKARRSNERIVFGLGHASVAEHAVCNFDVTGISRLAVEEIEHFRLASFTEKSQRYIRLGRDLVLPREIRGTGLEREFRDIVAGLHEAYEELFERLSTAGVEAGAAKEDARYLMPLATATQLGMTVNARELEYMIMRLAAHPLAELRAFSGGLYQASRKIIPSLIRYPEPTAHCLDVADAKREIAALVPARGRRKAKPEAARLVSASPEAERRLAACIIFSSCGCSMDEARRLARGMGRRAVGRVIRTTMRRLGPHDATWRELECVDLLFELVVSASCYAQLKRHRMATILALPYDVSLGVEVPETVRRVRAGARLRGAANRSERFYRANGKSLGRAAEYILTNAHRRRVLFGCNLRELYHFSRLRSDTAAQWEIRRISDEMCRLASEELPVAAMLLCGKDDFAARKRAFEGEKKD